MNNQLTDERDLFLQYIKKQDISINKVAIHIDYSRNHLTLVLKKRRDICARLKDKLNEYLGTDF